MRSWFHSDKATNEPTTFHPPARPSVSLSFIHFRTNGWTLRDERTDPSQVNDCKRNSNNNNGRHWYDKTGGNPNPNKNSNKSVAKQISNAPLRSLARSLVRSTCVTFIVINNVNSVCVCSSRPRHRDEFGLCLVRRRLLLLLLLLCAHCTSRTLTDAERMNKYCSE